VPCAGAQLAHC